MDKNKMKMLVMGLIFLGGLYFYVSYSGKQHLLEGLTSNNGEQRCPNLLIQKGSKYYLCLTMNYIHLFPYLLLLQHLVMLLYM